MIDIPLNGFAASWNHFSSFILSFSESVERLNSPVAHFLIASALTEVAKRESETATAITIAGDAWDASAALVDTTTALGRRVRVDFADNTSVMSPASLGFTVSDAVAVNAADPDVNFNAGGYTAATNTYDQSDGDLILKDGGGLAIMNGVKVVELWVDGAQVATDLTTADWTVNAAGTEITITQAKLAAAHSAWYTPRRSPAVIIFETVAGTRTTTAAFAAQP